MTQEDPKARISETSAKTATTFLSYVERLDVSTILVATPTFNLTEFYSCKSVMAVHKSESDFFRPF